ncbi:serine hydrolase [Actinocrispum wychmicini]|uniref:Beta-lactamase n=1 Tax=Actinocrispum wychmicini TaxID=1213861 RepID=A0A4R2J0V6_9PSEU|nr:serine hydrolase [Actinocrispum wychmicini]TCO48895.1 beta-lactamase class A [Actinocrispum wychmicini]
MIQKLTRRAAFGLGTAVAASAVLATPALADDDAEEISPATADRARRRVQRVYQRAADCAGGTWNSYISVADPDGTPVAAVDLGSDDLVEAYSVNKIAVATAVLDKVDRGLITLTQQVDVPASIVIPDGDGIIKLDRAYPSEFTVGHALALLLTVSDDTAVRLSGLVCPAKELNEILVAKGFPKTQVVPVANPNRFFLGKTTPRETHDLLQALVKGTLLSAASSDFLLNILRSQVAFTDGIRRVMSSNDRARVATKAGWLHDGRNEAGVMFDKAGKPVLTYSLFANGQGAPDDFGATHPAVQARSEMGPAFLRAVDRIAGAQDARTLSAQAYQPSNGG